MMTSYAQNREDVLLNRVFPAPVGFYLDVGAAHPIEQSVTKWFSDRGWTGINIEPQTGYFEALQADRPRDVNLNVGLSDTPGIVPLYEAPDFPGWATMDAAVADSYRSRGINLAPRNVPVLTLANVCERYVHGPIDFLKIDVEGFERQVLRGGDFTRWRPRLVVVEATEVGNPTPRFTDWEPLLTHADYLFATFDGLNRYYVRLEDRELAEKLQVPVNVFDEYTPYEYLWRVKGLERQLLEARARADDRDGLLEKLEKLAVALDWQTQHNEGLQREADTARARAVELERELEGTRALLERLHRETVSKSAYEAAVALLDRAKADLDALRAEIVDRVLTLPGRKS
jgi:FkbM family methyltransferase